MIWLELPATIPGLAAAGRWLAAQAEAARLPEETVFALEICLEEALGNVLHHTPEGVGPLRVGFQAEAAEVRLVVEDAGPPFDPTAHEEAPLPATLEDAPIGGLGLRLMRRFADSLRYERLAGRNVLTIVKALPGGRA